MGRSRGQAAECRRFDFYVVKGPRAGRLRFFHRRRRDRRIRTVLYIYRGGSGICVRPRRYALARWLTVPLGLDELGLHERDMPLCVKVCGMDRQRQHASVRSARSQAAVRNAAPHSRRRPEFLAVSAPADQIYVGAAQGHRRQNARPIRAIRRLSVTFFRGYDISTRTT